LGTPIYTDRTMSILGPLDTILVYVHEMEPAVTFYTQVLGFECGYSSEHWTVINAPAARIGLHSGRESSAASSVALCFQVASIAQLKAHLQQADTRIAPEEHETPRGRLIEFYDPSGNRLQAIELTS